MNKYARTALVIGAVLVSGVAGAAVATAANANGHDNDKTAAVLRALDGGRAKNVIMFLGDGMGDSEITIARNYARGAAGRLTMDGLPFTGEYTTYAVQKGTAGVPDYVTDSAASGTGWSTGHKTYNNAVSVDPVTLKPLTTILELAQRVAAQGPQAANVLGVTDQTDLFHTLARAIGVE